MRVDVGFLVLRFCSYVDEGVFRVEIVGEVVRG